MLPVLPQLIVPLKAALNTRDRGVVAVALRLLQKLVLATPGAGAGLVPYYRQLLPVLNLYRAWWVWFGRLVVVGGVIIQGGAR